jgi:hypothetical protein
MEQKSEICEMMGKNEKKLLAVKSTVENAIVPILSHHNCDSRKAR